MLARDVKATRAGKMAPDTLRAIAFAMSVQLKALSMRSEERIAALEDALKRLMEQRAAQHRLAPPVITDEERAQAAKRMEEIRALAHPEGLTAEDAAPEPAPEVTPETAAEVDAEAQREAERQRVQAELERQAREPDEQEIPWVRRGDYR